MRITKLVLEKCKRLMLSEIVTFEYHPTKPMQLILGTNGSGKSSILGELSPYPAHHSDFMKGGRKLFECEHRGKTYVLESIYDSGSGRHYLQRDDEVLNNWGTYAVQKELVEQEFGLTKEVLELLLGTTVFTDLTTAKRREWLTRLSPVDLDYAFEVYQKAKFEHRNQLGVIKHLTKRMGRENQDLPDDAGVAKTREEIKTLTNRLNDWFEQRQANSQAAFMNQHEFETTLERLMRDAKRLLTETPTMPGLVQQNSSESLTERLEGLTREQQRLQTLLDRMGDEHQQLLQQAPSRDEVLTEDQIRALQTSVANLKQEEQALTEQVGQYQGTFPLVSLPIERRPRDVLESTYHEWLSLLKTFPDNSEGYFTQARGEQTKAQLVELERDHRQRDLRQVTISQRLQRLKTCESVTCPKCEHAFQPGIDPTEIERREAELSSNGDALEGLEKEIQQRKQYLEDFEDYFGYVKAFRNLVHQSPLFKPLWDRCLEAKVMFRTPTHYVDDAMRWHQAMEVAVRLAEVTRERELMEHRLRYVEAIDRDALSQHDAKRQQLEREIEATTETLSAVRAQHRVLKQYYDALVNQEDTLKRFVAHFERFLGGVEQQRAFLVQEGIKEETRHLQLQLAQLQDLLSKIEVREGVLHELQTQLDEATRDHKDYGVLVRALGPTDGLIGRYLMGFMQNVVKLMNAIIDRVWTYPLEILPSKVEKDELDYRFPLNVNDGAVTPPDIKLGSSAQQDIVNFAFKLLVMKFLRLEDMPLYLDELGNMFDEQHRINIINFIVNLLELGKVDQVFFISHYAATHGAFTQAQVCVLDPTNITVPQVYNQHVTIA